MFGNLILSKQIPGFMFRNLILSKHIIAMKFSGVEILDDIGKQGSIYWSPMPVPTLQTKPCTD